MRTLLIIAMLGFALASNVGAQSNQSRKSSAKAPSSLFDEADALFGKRKRTTPRKAHDKYANQEVSYRQKTKTNKRQPKRTQITHDPEFENWANRKGKRNTR